MASAVLIWLGTGQPGHGSLTALLAYTAGLLGMLMSSAAYNLVPVESAARELLRRLDRAAIYTMVAGTCTVLVVNSVRMPWARAAALVIWSVALAGAAAAMLRPRRYEIAGIVVCLALGWATVALLLWGPAATHGGLGHDSIWWLLAGGLLYSVGISFHLWHALPFQNAIWHGFVVAAAACHYVAVLGLTK